MSQQVCTMTGNTPATDAYPSLENDDDGHVNGAAKKRKEVPVAASSHSSQYDMDHVRFWKALKDDFEELERSNCYSDILEFLKTRMPRLGDRCDLEAVWIPPVPAAVPEEPTLKLLLVRSDSSTFTGALLAAEPAALEASLIEINRILGSEESLKTMADDRCSKNTDLKSLASQLSADAFRPIWRLEYTAVKKSLENRMGRMVANYKAEISEAYTMANEVAFHLLSLSGLSQQTEVTYSQTTADANVEKAQEKFRIQFFKEQQRVEDLGIEQFRPNMIRDGVVTGAKPFDEYSEASLKECFHQKSLNGEDRLAFISKVYEALFSKACFIPRRFDENKTLYRKMLQKAISYLELVEKKIRDGTVVDGTCSDICESIRKENFHEGLVIELLALDEWLRSNSPQESKKPKISFHGQLDDTDTAALNELKGDECTSSQRRIKLCKDLLDKFMPQLLWLPGPTCQEVRGVQVVFQRLLGAIAACLPASTTVGKEGSERTTPEKHGKAERSAARTEHRPKRRSDFTIWIREKHIAIMWDDAMEVTIEIKPGQRMVSTLAELYQECLNQGLSRAAKSLLPALNLGSGLPAYCTFVVASPVYVQVLILSTVDTGTPNARVLLKQSVRFPLVSIENCDRYYASDQRHDKEVNAEFLGNGRNVDSIFAIKALAKIMTSPRDDLVGLFRRDSLLRVLGSGTYGQVLGTGNRDLVLKVSRHGRMAHLLDEVTVLQMLSKAPNDEVGRSNVISLRQFGMVPAKLCGVELPGATLSPRGVSAIGYDFRGLLGEVADGLRNGLAFLHSRGVAHNDFSYKNFVLVGRRAVIIDLACARPINTKMEEFVGTPDFAHFDVHMTPVFWLARAAHDMAGLAYTLCVVHNAGKIPWKPIGQPCKDNNILSERDKKTRSMFEDKLENQLEDKLVKELLAALQSNPIRACQCKSGDCGKAGICKVCTDSCTCDKKDCKKQLKPALAIDYVSRDTFVGKVLSLPDDTNGDFAGP